MASNVTVSGLKALKAAFRALEPAARDRLNWATEQTLRGIATGAKTRVRVSPSVRTRSLHDAIDWTLNRTTGRGKVGIQNITTTIGTRLVRPGRYAHLVELGTRHSPAEPFLLPAGEAEEAHYLKRCQVAGKQVEQDLARIAGGGRTL